MTPATRARLCAALERETGRRWAEVRSIEFVSGPYTLLLGYRGAVLAQTIMGPSLFRDLGPFTGRGWPERLAVEVARVLSETATTGGSNG